MINEPLPIHKDYNRDPYTKAFKGSNGDPNIKACKRVMLGILILRPLKGTGSSGSRVAVQHFLAIEIKQIFKP